MSHSRVPITLWGCSHLTNHHFFTEEFSKHHHQEKYRVRQIYAQGGYNMCESVIEEIKQDINETFENPQIVAVVLSSNNL